MKFIPKTESELNQSRLLEKGHYAFEVMDAKDMVSKNGNEMVELKLIIYPINPDLHPRVMKDWLLEKLAFKLKHFCETVGILYESGSLTASSCIGKSGMCLIGIVSDKNGNYPDKNSIIDYFSREKLKTNIASSSSSSSNKTEIKQSNNDLENDDIPF